MIEEICFPSYVLAKDCGEITEFSSSQLMQHMMEPIDVENKEYEAWDTNGWVLKLCVTKPKSAWLKVTRTQQRISAKELVEVKSRAKQYRYEVGGKAESNYDS